MEQQIEFENWYAIAFDLAKNIPGFSGRLDHEDAQNAYDEGHSPESYIELLREDWSEQSNV